MQGLVIFRQFSPIATNWFRDSALEPAELRALPVEPTIGRSRPSLRCEAEPLEQCVPRRSRGTKIKNGGDEREVSFFASNFRMLRISLARCVGPLFYCAVLMANCTLVLAQTNIPQSEVKWHVGCELFQMLLEERGISNIQTLESSLSSPSNSVIVITGDLRRLPADSWTRLVQYVGRGGNVLIASDQPRIMTGIGEIKPGPVVATRSEDSYSEFRDCIRIRDIDATADEMLRVEEIISNRSGWLVLPEKTSSVNPLRWKVIASLPVDCLPSASSQQPIIAVGSGSTPIAGVMILVADTSVLTNGMIWHGDNVTFAIRVSEVLGHGKRSLLTFVADGRVLASYKNRVLPPPPIANRDPSKLPTGPQLQDLPETDLATKLLIANHVLKSVSDSNILNEAMANQPRPVNSRAYTLALLGLAAAVLTLLLLAFLIRRVPALLGRQPVIPHISAFEMESGTKKLSSQYGPAAFILAREFCKECSGSSGERDWKNKATHFQISEAIPNDRALREKLEYVRSFEIGNLVTKVSESEFLKLGKIIHELRQALRSPKIDGTS